MHADLDMRSYARIKLLPMKQGCSPVTTQQINLFLLPDPWLHLGRGGEKLQQELLQEEVQEEVVAVEQPAAKIRRLAQGRPEQ